MATWLLQRCTPSGLAADNDTFDNATGQQQTIENSAGLSYLAR
jgi:hypothetical protein